jgi:hypothetical protein
VTPGILPFLPSLGSVCFSLVFLFLLLALGVYRVYSVGAAGGPYLEWGCARVSGHGEVDTHLGMRGGLARFRG